jgi:hypothetical protein
MISQETLREWLHYDPDTGDFTWLVSPASNIKPGTPAGNFGNVYLRITISGKTYYAHKLAWLYMTGEWPPNEVDHINQMKSDNRIINLRLATKSEQAQNRPASGHSQLGVKGVFLSENGDRYRARIMCAGVRYYLGIFDTLEEAARVRRDAELKLFGKFAPNANDEGEMRHV